MKKLCLTLLILFGSISAFSQSKFNPGLRFNPMITWLKMQTDDPGLDVSNKGIKMGYSYGIMGDYMFADNYGLSIELRFTNFGGEYQAVQHIKDSSNKDVPVTTDSKIRLQYLQIPVSFKMKTNEVGYIKYFGQFGFIPSINVRTRANTTVSSSVAPTVTTTNENVMKMYSPFNVFLLIGGGLEYNLGGSTSILAGLTFENGFLNLARKKPFSDTYGYTIDARAKVISLNLGILF